MHEHDCPNREKGTQDRKGDFFIHWHRDEFLSLLSEEMNLGRLSLSVTPPAIPFSAFEVTSCKYQTHQNHGTKNNENDALHGVIFFEE